jgi:hypothetical protein
MNIKALLLPALILVFLNACNEEEIGDSKDVAQERIYQHYQVTYQEGEPNATVTAQYRFAGKNGTTLVLNEPGKVEFDGEKLKVDSNGMGAWYRVSRPVNAFYGNHRIVYTDIHNKKLENGFSFYPFKLEPAVPRIPKNKPYKISFITTPLQENDYVEINSVDGDSSFSILHTGTDSGNSILIPAAVLQKQKQKSITFEVRLHRELPLQQQAPEGGKIEVEYSLKPLKINFTD